MRENKVRTIIQNGGAVVNGWLHIPSAYSAELMAHQGFDSVTIDLQHGLADYQTTIAMLQAISTTDTVPLARVTWNDPGEIMRLLDAGVYGIICPMINSRAEAEAFVGACRYSPEGYRSYGPNRARFYAGADYAEQANETVLAIAMIETVEALENLDEILSVPGLDGVYVGPADLNITLGGKERVDLTEPEGVAALNKIVEATKRHGLFAGLHCGQPAYALQMFEKGYQLATIASDARFLGAEASRVVSLMREGQTGQENSSPY